MRDIRVNLPAAERAQVEQTIVRVCARGHSVVVYYARRDQPEPKCPACGYVWRPDQDRRYKRAEGGA